jgi:hypothetical protein
MAIDSRLAQQSAIPGVYTTNTGTGINIAPPQPYYNINVDTSYPQNGSLKTFSSAYESSGPYHTSEVTEEFIRRLSVYTNAMLAGDIKQISSEYLWAVSAALKVLRHANYKISPELIEMMWKNAADGKGSLPEDFASTLQDHLLGR